MHHPTPLTRPNRRRAVGQVGKTYDNDRIYIIYLEASYMAQQQAIKRKIAGNSYSFTLKHEANEEQSLAEKEELYRLAEREVNAYVTRFEKAKYEGFSTQDCLAMAALQLAISSVSLARSREVGSEDLRRLEALRDEIDEYLNRIETEKK